MTLSLKRSLLLLLFLIVGVFIFKFMHPGSHQEAGVSEVAGSREGDRSSNGQVSSGGSEDQSEAGFPAIAMIGEEKQSSPVEEIFRFDLPLVEGINQLALSGQWNYDHKVTNLAVWDGLCQASEERLSALIDGAGESGELRANLSKLCHGYTAAVAEIDDYFEVELDEFALRVNERGVLQTSLEENGPDAATVFAIAGLSRALESLDYGGVMDIVGFLGFNSFDDVTEELSIYRNAPSLETIIAVSAAIFCNSIRGCGQNHPVVLNLCFQFHDLPCFRRPIDVYDAADQILTGYELETFSEMNRSLISLLNRYRRGDL